MLLEKSCSIVFNYVRIKLQASIVRLSALSVCQTDLQNYNKRQTHLVLIRTTCLSEGFVPFCT